MVILFKLAHVGKALFNDCLSNHLRHKTRILVTHQLQYLPKVDYIYVMDNGSIAEQGRFEELLKQNGKFSKLMETYGIQESISVKLDDKGDQKANLARIDDLIKKKPIDSRDVMLKEDRSTGSVKSVVWMTYFHASGGWPFITSAILVLSLVQVLRVGNDYWLVFWTTNRFPTLSQTGYILIYFAWAVAFSIAFFGFGVMLAFGGVRASRNLHQNALSKLLTAPTSFFDATPIGRIINRFSKDQDSIDNTMMESFRMFVVTLFNTLSTFAVILVATPWFAAPLVPVFCLYYFVQGRYRSISRELKRIDSMRRSPLYSLLGETLNGLPTIRAYGEQNRFISNNNKLVDYSISPSYLLNCSARWLGIRFETFGAILLFSAAIFGVITRDTISPSVYGLSLSYASQVTNGLNWCIRQFTETEIAMNAVERLSYYFTALPQEPPAIVLETTPKDNWPSEGTIKFDNVSMRYAPDLPLVLHNLSFTINPHEKVGVVGRTGSGKSSLMQLLFRMIEPVEGSIIIDDVNILKIGLQHLRKPLGIIPQDAILFLGTVRSNLDPFNLHSDLDIWDALRRAHIKSKIQELGGLDSKITAGGENLSVGQRQLLCLARSMLLKPKILVMVTILIRTKQLLMLILNQIA